MAEKAQEVKQSNKWRHILTWVTLGALLLLLFLLRDQISETFSNLDRVNVYILLFIIFWQVINYHTYAKLYQGLFDILGKKFKYKPMYKVAVELNFVNHVFPSAGVSGFSYFGLRMKQLGATPAQSTLVQTMRFITIFMSFQVLLLIGLFILAVNGKASNLTILVASSLGTLLVVGTLAIIYIVSSRRRIDIFFTALTKFLNKLIQVVRPKHPETINIASVRKLFLEFHENYVILKKNYTKLKMPLVYAFFASLTEILTIYTVYVAFGEFINFGAVIIAYAIANFAGLISVLPGGIGVYEGLMTAVLATVGVPPSTSLPITIMYRVLSSAVQLPPGYYLYNKAINKRSKPPV
ncbi:MAG: lysylphosphatidylglycerol synthase transmembrane domain-containing protein [Candidatus Saccharimonadales bacterium]